VLGHPGARRGGDEGRAGRDVEGMRRVAAGAAVSTRWASSFTSTWVASSRITCAAAAISPIDSFFTRSPTMNPAICAG